MNARKKVLAVAAAASLAVASALAGTGADFTSAFQAARRELLAGDYLKAVSLVRPFALTPANVVRDEGAFQVWDQMQAMISGLPSAFKPDVDEPPDRRTFATVNRATSRDALDAIVAGARRTRVVMLNENHRTPCQRTFATKVAEALRPLGYDTLALEALSTDSASGADDLLRRKYPVLSDGFYIRDPAFGALVRRSLELGYVPLAYEADTRGVADADRFRARERGQASKLVTYLRDHPGSKLLVYGGGGHLAERPLADGSKMMGQWFRELSDIDPLTIDQNQLQPGSALRRHLVQRKVAKDEMLFDGPTPVVVGRMAERVDMQVLPMSQKLVDGRPTCLLGGGRHFRRVKSGTMVRGDLLQAFGADEASDAVPLDQAVVAADARPPLLVLPSSKVRLVVRHK